MSTRFVAKAVKLLDRTSSVFFFLSFVASKLQFIPIALVSGALLLLSLALNFVGYLLWLVSSQLRPEQPGHKNRWYGFTQFKTQQTASALLGVASVAFFLLGIFFPPAIVVGVWCFALSKIAWVVAEYHKKQNPPHYDEDFSRERQSNIVYYSTLLTLIAIITAASTTVGMIFPPAAIICLVITISAGLILGGLAIHFWSEAALKPHEPDSKQHKESENSYEIALLNLGNKKDRLSIKDQTETDKDHTETECTEPYHSCNNEDLFLGNIIAPPDFNHSNPREISP